jgi:hypothetical protein
MRRRHHPVHIDEARKTRPEPQEVGADVVGVLVEGEEKRVGLADPPGEEGGIDQPLPAFRRVERELLGMRVVERKRCCGCRPVGRQGLGSGLTCG